ncbi:MAG TPA: M23 family metallopeptidase [Chryseosolibacter sp.]
MALPKYLKYNLRIMRYTTFRYNTRTCKYERVNVKAKSVIGYCLGLGVMASCMLVGILLLHDLLVNTDNENRLGRENKALRRHHAILTTQLQELQPVLASLENKDNILHTKFFGSEPLLPPKGVDRASKERLLLADADSFRSEISALKESSEVLLHRSEKSNALFADVLSVDEDDLEIINCLPTLQPVQQWQPASLISGFGMRVNPFHKGLYEHLGIDIAMPRGTPVIAPASGKIAQLKRSDLQAGYGNYIEIDHGNGVVTRFAHLQDIQVKFGAKVTKGEVVATIGTSGGSVAPHLHYEILREGKNVDPVHYMVEGLTPSQYHFLAKLSHQQNQSLD